MKTITPEKHDFIRDQMVGLSGKEARAKAEMLVKLFAREGIQVSVDLIYRHSRDVRPKRKQRADNGTLRAIDRNGFDTMLYYTAKHDFCANHICDVARANGVATIAPTTWNRILRERRLDRKTLKTVPKPWMSWGADEPNQIHQIDTTLSEQFYIDDDLSIGYESPQERYKNKPGNRKTRLTLFSLVDDFSRAKFAMFIPTNTTESWMNALYEAWRIKDDLYGFPFHGLPRILYCDNDSVVKSKKFKHAIEEIFGITIITHKVGSSQSKGKVEQPFKVFAEFQKVTQVCKWQSLDEANAALFDFLYKINGKEHSATGERPFMRWITIEPSKLKAVPSEELFALLKMDWDKRQIRPNLTISIDGTIYQLPFKEPYINHIKQRVEVFWYPGDLSKIYVVLDGKSYEVLPKDKMFRTVGQAKMELPVPEFLKRKDEIEEKDDPGLKLTGIYKERYRQPYLAPKVEAPFDDSKFKAPEVVRSKAWFIMELRRAHRFFGQADHYVMEYVENVFQGAKEMPETELRKALKRLADGLVSIYPNQQATSNQ
ncbi:MAG: hypothetical protein ACE5I1_21470 [bacterium]